MDEQLKSNLTSSKHWLRLIFMLLFAVLLQVSLAVMWVLVAIQFIFALVTGKDNLNLRSFGDSLSQYIFQTIRFLTYNSEDKPFPFADWPEPDSDIEVATEAESDSDVTASEAPASEALPETEQAQEPTKKDDN